jgi:dihydropteroate synthase
MSERNVEIVRSLQAAFRRGDYEAAIAPIHEDVVYEFDLGTFRGHDGIRRVYASWLSAWEDSDSVTERVIGAGDRVVAFIRNRGRSRASGVELDERVALVYTLRDGKVVHMKNYRDRAEALREAGMTDVRFARPAVMGVLNVTPDSFSDGGAFLDPGAALAHAGQMRAAGADLIDVGGESTRPGAAPVSTAEELRRVMPVVEALGAEGSLPVSIDTSKASVASAALEAGASFVNDVTALRGDAAMAAVVARADADVCLMHMLGEPRTMQDDPRYDDVVSEVAAFLEERLAFAVAQGIAEERVWLDPGIGFGKTLAHNLELLRRLDVIVALGRPVVVGASRKRFIGALTGRAEEDRIAGTVAANVIAFERGAHMFRVHDVGPARDALAVASATVDPSGAPAPERLE